MIYDRIKAISVKRKISISSIETMAGVSNGSISKWNESSPTVENLKKVADVLDMTVDELINDEVDTKQEVIAHAKTERIRRTTERQACESMHSKKYGIIQPK